MSSLYNYGISQEDVLSEMKALNIHPDDSFLCIASGGEIPLNMAAIQSVKILAVDNSMNQLRLCRIKLIAATILDSERAASFLGYMKMSKEERLNIFQSKICTSLSEDDKQFWEQNTEAIKQGVVNMARFEKYIRKFSSIGRIIIGKKNFFRLFECNTIEEQQNIFDKKISSKILKLIFKIAFHPKVYKDNGIDPTGLTHNGNRNIAEFFFQRFRSFCCNTLARKNYYLQYTFFNKVIYPEALPEFLQPQYHDSFVKNCSQIEFRFADMTQTLSESETNQFNKIHLSNIGDWMSKDSMEKLFKLLKEKTNSETRIVLRYIHLKYEIPTNSSAFIIDNSLGESIINEDRYPFYSIMPILRN